MVRTIGLGVIGGLASLGAGLAYAEDWTVMDPQDLAGLSVQYEAAEQRFGTSGKTLYDAGNPSWGNWRSDGGKYCSQWPPNSGWTCYLVERAGDQIRFTGPGNDISVGTLK